jgi:hypothetical protein
VAFVALSNSRTLAAGISLGITRPSTTHSDYVPQREASAGKIIALSNYPRTPNGKSNLVNRRRAFV